MLSIFARKRSTPDPPLPLLEALPANPRVEAPVAPVDPIPTPAKKVRAKRPTPTLEATTPAVEDDNSDRSLLRQHLFAAAEAERKLAIVVKALRQIAAVGEKHPDRLAASTLAQIAK